MSQIRTFREPLADGREVGRAEAAVGEYGSTSIVSSPSPFLVAAIDRSRKGCSLRSGFGSTTNRWTSAGIQAATRTTATTRSAPGMPTNNVARACVAHSGDERRGDAGESKHDGQDRQCHEPW